MSKRKHDNREQWLGAAAVLLAPWFKEQGHPLELKKINFSCSWPGGGSAKAIGECWYPQPGNGGQHEVFISPTLEDSCRVIDIVIHELCHVALGGKVGHRAPFGKLARALGLTGKMTATVATDELNVKLRKLVKQLGKYPHKKITGMTFGKKKETYLIKVYCPRCDYTTRITNKWIDVGVPECPNYDCSHHGYEMTVENK